MPSEHEDPRARQLEALRRYMAQLGTGDEPDLGEPAGPAGAPGRGRPSWPWLALTGLLVAVALVGGVFVGAAAWSDDRPAGDGRDAAATPASLGTAGGATTPVATLACKTAVDRANAMLASAVKLREDLAEHDQTLRDASGRGLTAAQLLERLAPLLQAGAGESARFDHELDAYRQVVDQCDVRAS
jgi:hypothetical protein